LKPPTPKSFMSHSKAALLCLLFFIPCSPAGANPFLSGSSSSEGAAVQPQPVRPPVLQGPGELGALQMKIRNRLAEIFVPSGQATPALRAALLLTALAYGFLHALGPGHRKTVVFTLFLSRKTRWWEPAAAGFLSAGAHGGMGIFLILLLRMLNPLSLLQDTENASRYLEGGTYLALALVGTVFLAGALKQLIRGEHRHHHDGGNHGAGTVARGSRGIYLTVLTASLFPCPGSILILLFSLSLGEIGWGILAVLFLSLGMGVTITGAALLARTGREGLFRRLGAREKGAARLSAALESGAYLFLVGFSLWMAAPFALSLFPAG